MRTLLIVLFAFNSLQARAQSKIEGIGVLKLGRSKTQILDSLQQTLGKPIPIVYAFNSNLINDNHIYQITGDIYNRTSDYYTKCPDYEIYLIPWYDIATLVFKNVRLAFKSDTLNAIHADIEASVAEAIELKYGKAVPRIKTQHVSSTYGGATIQKETTKLTKSFRADAIDAYYDPDLYYFYNSDWDPGCHRNPNPSPILFFTCEYRNTWSNIFACDRETKEREKALQNLALKKKLEKL